MTAPGDDNQPLQFETAIPRSVPPPLTGQQSGVLCAACQQMTADEPAGSRGGSRQPGVVGRAYQSRSRRRSKRMPGGLISAAIIGFGMHQAWRMTAAPQLTITGPYRVGTVDAAAS